MVTSLLSGVASADTEGYLSITSDTVLTEDHQGPISIDEHGVALDCDGHLVTGVAGEQGIWVDGYRDVTITRCHVTGALNGIAVTGGAQRASVIDNRTFANGNAGIAADRAVETTISGNVSRRNGGNGIQVIDAAGARVVGNTSVANDDKGIGTARASESVFLRNTVRRSLGFGMTVGHSSNGNLVARNTIEATVGIGLHVTDSAANVIPRPWS